MMPAIKRAGLVIIDIEILRLHYATAPRRRVKAAPRRVVAVSVKTSAWSYRRQNFFAGD